MSVPVAAPPETTGSHGASPPAPPPSEPPRGPLWKRLVFGAPIHTRDQEHVRLSKRIALPVFASDAISSVSYATQEILLALGGAGLAVGTFASAYRSYLWWVTIAIVFLLSIVVFSYRQTIAAYPKGGGSYIVTKDNLGMTPGLVAGAALMIDYVLTVAVSVSAGAQNLLSTPFFHQFPLSAEGVCLLFIGLLTLANLRGLKESGALFALPTYFFIVLAYLMIGLGLLGPLLGWTLHPEAVNQIYVPEEGASAAGHPLLGIAGILIALKAFSSGCTAMTGTEAISDGVQAFRKPESHNASVTLTWMAVILGTLFLGTSALASKLHVVYWSHSGESARAVIDQFSGAVFGRAGTWSFLYYMMQFATAGILVLAANTAFADFPRLASFLANDRFLPKELAHRGDRLVFGRGILLLGFFAALLVVVFAGSVDRLIPLYAVGVFTAFTLSQCSMVQRWRRERGKGWHLKAAVNGVGATATFIVFLVVLIEKWHDGAWVVVLVAGVLISLFMAIHHRYTMRARGLALEGAPLVTQISDEISRRAASHTVVAAAPPAAPSPVAITRGTILRNMPDAPVRNTVLVLVPGVHKGILPAINYARLLTKDFRAIYIEIEPELTEKVKTEWEKYLPKVPLQIIESPYRSLIQPLMDYIDVVTEEHDDDVVTLVLPESFSGNWLDTLLRSTAATQVKLALLGREDVVVVNVRYRLAD